MNGKTLALCVLSSVSIFSLNANTRGFAPYDKVRGFSLDSRFDGNFLISESPFGMGIYALAINGYYKGESGWFGKLGVKAFVHLNRHRNFPIGIVPWPLPNLQVGKYRKGVGAFRFGFFHGLPGIGGDYWVKYDRFKWLTTLELYVYTPRCGGLAFGVSWLNRFFLTDRLYVSAGINYFGTTESRGLAFGSVGLGLAF